MDKLGYGGQAKPECRNPNYETRKNLQAPMFMRIIKITLLLSLPVLLLLGSGCGTYYLGTTLPSDLRTVYVYTFKNSATEPGIESDITNAVIRGFRIDGNLQPTSESEADTILEGEITAWERKVMGYQDKQETAADEYRLYITVAITFKNVRTSEKLIAQEKVQGYTDFLIEGTLPESEEAARPDAYKDLARRVVDKVVSIW